MSTRIIDNQPYTISDYLKKLSRYGYLIRVLAIRELKAKYTRTALGIGWLFLQPLAVVLVYSFFFNNIIKINTGSIPYPSFVFSGLVLWYLFTGIVSRSTFALPESSDLIHKVPFPRLIILFAKVIPVVLECLVLLLFLFIVLLITHQPFGMNAFTALFYFLQVTIFSSAVGLLCSVIAVKYRDVSHLIPFAMNFAIWLTPVFYSISIVPATYQSYLLYLNPLTLPIEGLRSALFFDTGISNASVFMLLFSCLFFSGAFYYFIKFEKKLVESL